MPSISQEQREEIESVPHRHYCHFCDEIYFSPTAHDPSDGDHDQHEQDRAAKWRAAGLNPYP